jgi:hypothetical protein
MAVPSVATVLGRALDAYARLEDPASEVEEEAVYVADLVAAWRARLAAVGAVRSDEPAPPGAAEAIEVLAEEALLITDPHRAIDWLSTFPQVALAAVWETG